MNKMTPFKELISYEEALERIRKSIKPIRRTEIVPIEEALNRVLAEDIVAIGKRLEKFVLEGK